MHLDLTPFSAARHGEQRVESVLVLSAGPVSGLGREAAVATATPVRVSVQGNARQVRVDVEAAFVLDCTCDRCLAAVSVPVRVAYGEEWRLSKSGREGSAAAAADPSAQAAIDGDAEAFSPRDAADVAHVGLDDGLWQHVAFVLPAKVLCREDCRGLCPRCGADLNAGSCACPGAEVDPRLAALTRWRAAPPR